MIILYFLLMFQNYTEQDYISEIFKEKDILKIEKIYNEADKIYPESYSLSLNTAYRYLLMKKYKKSYILYKKSYAIYPSLDALLGLTYTQTELNKFEELLKVTSTYKYKNKKLEKWIYLRRSYAYLMLKEYNKAIKEADRGLERFPDFELLVKNKKYAQKMKPKLSVNLIPVWGIINYKNEDYRISYSYWGGILYSRYDYYSLDLGYTNGSVKDVDKTRTEHDIDFGMGYNNYYNFYFHIKKVFLTDNNSIVPYFHIGYNFKYISFITAFSVSFYEYSENPVYQGGLYSYFYLFDRKVVPLLGAGYKYLSDDKKTSKPYFEAGLNLYLIKTLGIKTLFRYAQHTYFVAKGGVVDNSLDDINWMIEGGLNINLSGFIVSPVYRYYSINVPVSVNQVWQRGGKNTNSKSFFTIVLGYKF